MLGKPLSTREPHCIRYTCMVPGPSIALAESRLALQDKLQLGIITMRRSTRNLLDSEMMYCTWIPSHFEAIWRIYDADRTFVANSQYTTYLEDGNTKRQRECHHHSEVSSLKKYVKSSTYDILNVALSTDVEYVPERYKDPPPHYLYSSLPPWLQRLHPLILFSPFLLQSTP